MWLMYDMGERVSANVLPQKKVTIHFFTLKDMLLDADIVVIVHVAYADYFYLGLFF